MTSEQTEDTENVAYAAVTCKGVQIRLGTSYDSDDRGFGGRVPVGSRMFTSPRRPERFCGPPSLIFNGYPNSILLSKATET
jgi:hypothetical protein